MTTPSDCLSLAVFELGEATALGWRRVIEADVVTVFTDRSHRGARTGVGSTSVVDEEAGTGPSRRDALLISAGVLGALGAGLDAQPAAAAPGSTTLSRTIVRGVADGAGFRRQVAGPGEPYLLRSDLGGAASGSRARTRRPVAAFVQLTDVHVQDTQSPARFEFLDRYSDTSSEVPFQAAYRPHEMLSTQVVAATVQAVRQLRSSPALGQPLQFAISTGDATDNCQRNELRWTIGLLDGGRVVPDSGAIGRFEGVADGDSASYDTAYWHPEGTPAGRSDDAYRAQHGFPTVPGLLSACIRPFTSPGLGLPWLAVHGNHDGLLTGNFPISPAFEALAVGALKPIGLPPGTDAVAFARELVADPAGTAAKLAALPARVVTPDPDRHLVNRKECVEAHFNTSGTPAGHGFTADNRRDGTAYYVRDTRLPGADRVVRLIVLDTVNENGEADGSLDTTQFAWLKQQLLTAPHRMTVVFSHHTTETMGNALVGTGADPATRVLGPEVLQLLLDNEQVVLWVNGHTHENRVTPRPRGARGGFWEITTASHIDWPEQLRTIEIADNRDGTLSIFGTIVDSAAPVTWNGDTSTPLALASLSRALAANDPQETARPDPTRDGLRGSRNDRNVELILPTPAVLQARYATAR